MIAPLLLAFAAVPAGAPPPQAHDPRRNDWQQMFGALAAVAAGTPPPAAPQAHDPRRGDWQQAYDARRDGRILPLREIERRVVPTMAGAQYLGFEFEGETGLYTLKFLRNGAVIWVDVDGRSGQIVRRTGK